MKERKEGLLARRKKRKIYTKILLSVVVICLFATVSLSVASYITVRRIINHSQESNHEFTTKAREDAKKAMLGQTKHFLQLIAKEQAGNCESVLKDVQYGIRLMEGSVKDVFANPEYYAKGRPIIKQKDVTPGTYSNAWAFPKGRKMTPKVEKEIAMMSNLESIMPALADNPDILDLYVGLESGLMYCYTDSQLDDPEYDPRERPWYVKALEQPNAMVVTDAYENALRKGMVITCAKAVSNGDGGILGVVGVDISLEGVKDSVLRTQILESGYAFVLDGTGRYVVHPEMDAQGFNAYPLREGEESEFREGYKRMRDGEDGYVVEERDGDRLYLTYSHVKAANWSVGVVVSESEILSSLQTFTDRMLTLTNEAQEDVARMSKRTIYIAIDVFVIVTMMVLIISINLTRMVSRPIHKLTAAIEKIGKGNLEYKIPVETQDEIGILTEAFNKMTDNIYEYTQNILELNNVNSKLKIAAYTDALTGILNRGHFKELAHIQLEHAVRSNSKAFVILMDVDHFKEVNDTYGHMTGDVVLRTIASRVKEVIRPYDLFARYGGEEFVLFITNVDHGVVVALAERIRKSISHTPVLCDGEKILISASFGIAPASPEFDLDTALKTADEAMYQAKRDGRDRVVYLDH